MRTVGLALLWIAGQASAQVSGTVVDSEATPIAGAIVTLQATEISVQTNADGEFELPAPDGAGVVVAANRGYFHAGLPVTAPQSGIELQLEPVPVEDSPLHAFSSATTCAECHPNQWSQWQGSAMGHAGTNAWVHDIYDGNGTPDGSGGFVYTRDSIHAADNPASECAACHQPLAWIATPFSALLPSTSSDEAVADGVACVVCHQIADIDLSRPNAPGIFPDVVTMTRTADSSPVMYGLLGDVTFEDVARMRAAYNPQLASEICAACHQDANDPDGDHDYDEPGSIISEPTYLEWAASTYADESSENFASCIDCHMPVDPSPAACDRPVGYVRPLGQLHSHAIAGTTPAFLDNAVTLALEARREGAEIVVDVTITNDQTGHHVPTGVTIRNMILLVEATRDGEALDHTGAQVLHDLAGVGSPAMGYFAGLPGKLYAKINRAEDGTSPTFFTDATSIVEDNRIAALESDATSYVFTDATGGAVEVRARLIYRRSWRALVDAKGWTTDGHGGVLEDLQPPHFGHLMEEAVATLDAAELDAGTDAGSDGGAVDAGADAGVDADGGGCGCSVPDRRSGWLAALVLLLLRRRRTS